MKNLIIAGIYVLFGANLAVADETNHKPKPEYKKAFEALIWYADEITDPLLQFVHRTHFWYEGNPYDEPRCKEVTEEEVIGYGSGQIKSGVAIAKEFDLDPIDEKKAIAQFAKTVQKGTYFKCHHYSPGLYSMSEEVSFFSPSSKIETRHQFLIAWDD